MLYQVFIGVDPGKTGAVAFLRPQKVHFLRMPLDRLKGKEWVNPKKLHDEVVGYLKTVGVSPIECFATIENQHARVIHARAGKRVDTPTTAMALGWAFGCAYSALSIAGIPLMVVEPGVWQKEFSIGGGEDEAVAECKRLLPHACLVPDGCRKEHDGYADSALIAEYGRRRSGGEAGGSRPSAASWHPTDC